MEILQRVADLMQGRPVNFQSSHGGYTLAQKGRVVFDNGQAVFLKAAASDETAEWLRTEYAVYSHLSANDKVDFLPKVLAWEDDGTHPILILEDLSAAYWPPPWDRDHVQRVTEVLSRLRQVEPMPNMTTLESYRNDLRGWNKIAVDAGSFLSLNLCTPAWLDAALPVLIAAESSVDLGGSDFLHLDVRSDNLCFLEDRTILIDWNWSCVGNGMFDLAFWLPSLHAEGGPAPESILPNSPEMASAVSGFWAAQAGLPPHGSRLRQVQLTALKTAFPWTVRALGLPPI